MQLAELVREKVDRFGYIAFGSNCPSMMLVQQLSHLPPVLIHLHEASSVMILSGLSGPIARAFRLPEPGAAFVRPVGLLQAGIAGPQLCSM
jgi:hypothetical protein